MGIEVSVESVAGVEEVSVGAHLDREVEEAGVGLGLVHVLSERLPTPK